MRKIKKIVCVVSIVFTVLAMSKVFCVADMQECHLTINLEEQNGKTINDVTVSVCKIADLSGTDYYPAEEFENSGISISAIVNNPSETNAQGVLKYIKENNICSLSAVSKDGKAFFSPLDTGIWFVYCNEGQAYKFKPYFVFMPYALNGELYYEVTSTPKTDENLPDDKEIYVVKKWDDKNNEASKRPEFINVYLICDGKKIDSVILNEGNGWSYTFTNLSDEGEYSVEEEPVTDYLIQYNGDSENGFIITNIYNGEQIPVTGQHWWPIAIIFIAGVAFVLLGIIELKGKKEENETK